jgi:stage V sporulation protein K
MDVLLSHNPGVRSRFPTVIQFENYNAGELMQIFDSMMRSDDLQLEDAARSVLLEKLRQMESVVDKENGNGRAMRNLLDAAKRRQALRLQQLPGRKTVEQLRQLTVSDIQ